MRCCLCRQKSYSYHSTLSSKYYESTTTAQSVSQSVSIACLSAEKLFVRPSVRQSSSLAFLSSSVSSSASTLSSSTVSLCWVLLRCPPPLFPLSPSTASIRPSLRPSVPSFGPAAAAAPGLSSFRGELGPMARAAAAETHPLPPSCSSPSCRKQTTPTREEV